MAWFWRGAQSAVFYYLSFAPCANYAFERRRSKEKAKADKATKEIMKYASRHGNGEVILPQGVEGHDQERVTGLGAFTTNIYWREEMVLGPQSRKERHRTDHFRGKDAADTREDKMSLGRRTDGGGLAFYGNNTCDVNQHLDSYDDGGFTTINSTASAATSSDGVRLRERPVSIQYRSGEENWDDRRYQRPDEALWGNPVPEKNWNFYARGRNPSINSLCPPVQSTKPATANEACWMLQPPPPAKVMEGKQQPAIRYQSVSAISERSAISQRYDSTPTSRLKKPERILSCVLGERMNEMELPKKSEQRLVPRSLNTAGTGEEDDMLYSPIGSDSPADLVSWNAFDASNRGGSFMQLSLAGIASSNTESERVANRGSFGFDPSWAFPRAPNSPWSDHGLASNIQATGKPRVESYYHSEPEPELCPSQGIASQDFAASSPSLHGAPILRTNGPLQTPMSMATSRAKSSSLSTDTLSMQSSNSSPHRLRDSPLLSSRLPLTGKSTNDNSSHSKGVDISLPKIDRPTKKLDQSSEYIPEVSEYWPSPRQMRLGSEATI